MYTQMKILRYPLRRSRISKKEFLANCATNLGITVEKLARKCEFAVVCRCPFSECSGWTLVGAPDVAWAVGSGNVDPKDLPPLLRSVLEN